MSVEGTPVARRPRFETRAPKLGHQPALDGMRGYGIIAVLIAHTFLNTHFPSFAAAVDMFFVISGFLIITLLLEESGRSSAINLRNFYRRRAYRLLPMLFLVIAFTLASLALINVAYGSATAAQWPDGMTNGDLLSMAGEDAIAGSFYMYHVLHPVGTELVNGSPDLRPLSPLWSLSVEEHFYILGVITVVIAIARRLVKPLVLVLIVGFVFIASARLLGYVGPRLAWYQRPDAIFVGVVLAFINARMPTELSARFARNLGRGATLAAFVAAGTVFVGSTLARPFNLGMTAVPAEGQTLRDGFFWAEIGFTLISLSCAVVILAMARLDRHWLQPVLGWKPMQVIGVRSYSIYLIHVPLLLFLVNAFGDRPELGLILYFPLLAVTSELAHRYVEKPFIRRKDRAAKPTPATSGALAEAAHPDPDDAALAPEGD